MNRWHALAISLVVAVATVVGLVATTRTTHLGAKTAAAKPVARAVIVKHRRSLDRWEASLHQALAKKPPHLPKVPKYPKVSIPPVPAYYAPSAPPPPAPPPPAAARSRLVVQHVESAPKPAPKARATKVARQSTLPVSRPNSGHGRTVDTPPPVASPQPVPEPVPAPAPVAAPTVDPTPSATAPDQGSGGGGGGEDHGGGGGGGGDD